MTTYYEANCEFCGEDVGPPEDARPFFTFGDVTCYPGGESHGVQILIDTKGEEWKDPEDKPAYFSVHHECWNAYWGGTLAGKRFYEQDTTD